MASRQKERALTSPKTSALAFISVLPWRINDGADSSCLWPGVGCTKLVKSLRGCDESFSSSHWAEQLCVRRSRIEGLDLGKFTHNSAIWLMEIAHHFGPDRRRLGGTKSADV